MKKLTTQEVSIIKRRILNGEYENDIANDHGVPVRNIRNIRTETTFKKVEVAPFDPDLDYDYEG